MAILRGHEDLKHKPVVGFDMGFALVQHGDTVKRYRMTIGPGGNFHGEPVDEQAVEPPDQVGQPRVPAMRHYGVDQIGFHGLDQVE